MLLVRSVWIIWCQWLCLGQKQARGRWDWWFNYRAIHFVLGMDTLISLSLQKRNISELRPSLLSIQLTLYCNLICYNFVSCIILHFECASLSRAALRLLSTTVHWLSKTEETHQSFCIHWMKMKSNWKWEKLDEMTFLIKKQKIAQLFSTTENNESFHIAWKKMKRKLSIKIIKQWKAFKLFTRFNTSAINYSAFWAENNSQSKTAKGEIENINLTPSLSLCFIFPSHQIYSHRNCWQERQPALLRQGTLRSRSWWERGHSTHSAHRHRQGSRWM